VVPTTKEEAMVGSRRRNVLQLGALATIGSFSGCSAAMSQQASTSGRKPVDVELRSEFLLQLRADLEDPQNVGAAPLGMRRIMYFKRGTFSGPSLTGDILPGGGDWVLVRPDGVSQLDIRMILRTDDGALIYLNATGIFDMASEVRARFNRGESVGSSEYYFRTSFTFETAAEKYRWLNRLVGIGVAQRIPTGMVTDVFAIR
jgi:Protein of unknown function (DUF3237)